MMKKLILPNFIIAGGVATGTSFLSHALSQHHQIYLPKIMRPECSFFYKSWEYAKGLNYYSEKYFSDVSSEIAVGERSSLYLHGDFLHVAGRIKETLADVKLIFCLRNPIERAFANYRFSVLSGFETKSFEKALELEEFRFQTAKGWKSEIQPNLYLRRGNYFSQLTPFFEKFPMKNLLFIKSESMNKNPENTMKMVYDFLQVEPLSVEFPTNFSSNSVKSRTLQVLLRKYYGNSFDQITENIRSSGPKIKNYSLLNFNLTNRKKFMNPNNSLKLRDFYSEQNQSLAKVLDWDLSDWK
jgi:hypothetical protein